MKLERQLSAKSKDRMGRMEHERLTEKIIGCAMKVHTGLGPGFLESVYQNALAYEIRKAGIKVDCERALKVEYDQVVVGQFYADMVVEDEVLVENKAVQNITTAHEVQVVNYLTATGIEVGLLLNFGSSRLQFKRKPRTYRPKGVAAGQQETVIHQSPTS